MNFNTYFKASSYAMIAVAMSALAVAGGLHYALVLLFAALMVLSWKVEGSRWQLSERVGLVIVVFSIPLFFLDWKLQQQMGEPAARLGVSALAHLIAFLSAIKLLQVKSDRDWVFLYLISFFEILLAAGLSFSPVFLGTLSLYLLCALSTVIAFEIRKATRAVKLVETRLLVPPDSSVFKRLARRRRKTNVEANRLPITAFLLLCFIFVLAFPLFLVAPRASAPAFSRTGSGANGFIGFSENVALGDIGTLKRNDQVVMHVRLADSQPPRLKGIRWRGVALDEFTGRSWRKSAQAKQTSHKVNERGSFRVGTTDAPRRLVSQTVFLEPIDTAILFAAPQPVLIQGAFPFLRVDAEGSVQFRPHDTDRLIYKALSDTSEPQPDELRLDRRPYSPAFDRYRELPGNIDPRIGKLAREIVTDARARNRYDIAAAIESHLRSNYGYSLDRRATGDDPLSDFLFNVQKGHCEYFSTAMAVMLRTVGIASRVVNGFLPGEYNEAADAYTVRQSDAHSWVEVYFPETNTWITFDPTPPAGQSSSTRSGITAMLSKYAEALELVWFQYVVGYDQQEQRSLATTLHNRLFQYQRVISDAFNKIKNAPLTSWRQPSLFVLGIVLLLLFLTLGLRIWKLGWRGFKISHKRGETETSSVEFYRRLTNLLAQRGISRPADQTPLEFATQTGMDIPVRITRAYNRVRYGSETLTSQEAGEIDRWLTEMEREEQREKAKE
jgi:protein-glutamine gamma-glutamyltransferase